MSTHTFIMAKGKKVEGQKIAKAYLDIRRCPSSLPF
jgi:hypothetical protein